MLDFRSEGPGFNPRPGHGGFFVRVRVSNFFLSLSAQPDY